MESKIGEIYVLYPTAKSIWDVVSHSYSNLEDSSQMFVLRNRVCNLRQEDASVIDYFHSLTRLWQELDLFQHHNWHDPKDSNIYRDTLLKERTYDFLDGLNPSLDEVRGRILGLKPLPVINEIFAIAKNIARVSCWVPIQVNHWNPWLCQLSHSMIAQKNQPLGANIVASLITQKPSVGNCMENL